METPSAHYTELVLLVLVGSMQVKALNASSACVRIDDNAVLVAVIFS